MSGENRDTVSSYRYAIDQISPDQLKYPNKLSWTSWDDLRKKKPGDAIKIEQRVGSGNSHITTFRFSNTEGWRMPKEETERNDGTIDRKFQEVDWSSPRATDQYSIVQNILYRKRDGIIYATPLIDSTNTSLAPHSAKHLEQSGIKSPDIKIIFDQVGVSKISMGKAILDIPMQRYTPEQFALIKDYIQKLIVHIHSLEQQGGLSGEIKANGAQRLQIIPDAITVNNRDWLPDTRVLSNKRIQEIFLVHESTELEAIKKKLTLFMNTVLVGMNKSAAN